MEKNFIEKYGERMRKRKEEKKQMSDKYWKLPATERLHYDYRVDKINSMRWGFLYATFYFLKAIFFTIIALVFVGFVTSNAEHFIKLAFTVFFQLLNMLGVFILVDLIMPLYFREERMTRLNKLKKRFKL